MDTKTTLYLRSEEGIERPQTDVNPSGWRKHETSDPLVARELIHDLGLRVALVRLDGTLWSERRDDVTTLIAATAGCVQWVGLIEPVALHEVGARELIAGYLYDYHTLPADSARLNATLGHALGMAGISKSVVKPVSLESVGGNIVGSSAPMRKVFAALPKVAAAMAPVIVTGETGTGKELVARAIHRQSGRRDGPFVAVNCGALPASLIQSELFGHEKGAFTGADRRKIGRIEAAHGGTVFLDEIGDLALELQANLLRFFQEGTIERLGGTQTISVDARVITATHRDVGKAVEAGDFREDLYYRLNVLSLELPPLREREGDIEQLAEYFLQKFRIQAANGVKGFGRRAILAMQSYTWPGNVRELINKVHRAVVMCDGRLVTSRCLGFEEGGAKENCITLAQARAEADKQTIRTTLHDCCHNVSRAARRLGVSRLTLYRLMDKYGFANRAG